MRAPGGSPAGRLELRDFTATDDASLISWITSAEDLERFAGPDLRWPLTSQQLQEIREEPAVGAWTACITPRRDLPVGHVEVIRTSEAAGRLARVLIDPARRGEGLGRQLVSAALERATRQGLRALDLKVLADNAPAIRTYAALGFTHTGQDQADPRVRVLSRSLS